MRCSLFIRWSEIEREQDTSFSFTVKIESAFLLSEKHLLVSLLLSRRAQDSGSLPVGPSFHARENICFSSLSYPLVKTQ